MNGITLDEVKEEMQQSIYEAAKNPSTEFKASFGDKEPSIEEFISKMSDTVTKRTGN